MCLVLVVLSAHGTLNVLAQDCCPHNAELCASDGMRELRVPRGFCLSYFLESKMITGPRSLNVQTHETLGTVVFVGARGADMHAVIDSDQDGVADSMQSWDLAGGNAPGADFDSEGVLWTSVPGQLARFDNIFEHLVDGTSPDDSKTVVWDSLPGGSGHSTRYLAIDSEGYAYTAIGAPCNLCIPEEQSCSEELPCHYATIIRGMVLNRTEPMTMDDWEVYAEGVRSCVGMAFHPEDDALWFSDNGRDWWGDERPPCEINRAAESGLHFGYPYCHGYNEVDDEMNEEGNCDRYTPNAVGLLAHAAPLGITFYTNTNGEYAFPSPYNGGLFVTEHGSWNRNPYIGVRVMHVSVNEDMGASLTREPILDGFLLDSCSGQKFGRPADVQVLPDGSLIVSDDQHNAIWRITWEGSEEDTVNLGLGPSVDDERANLTCIDTTTVIVLATVLPVLACASFGFGYWYLRRRKASSNPAVTVTAAEDANEAETRQLSQHWEHPTAENSLLESDSEQSVTRD